MSNEIIEITTYDIPESSMETLHAAVKKLNKRAAKLDAAPIEVIVHSEKFVADPDVLTEYFNKYNRYPLPEEKETFPKVKIIEVEIKGEPPKIAGWKFIGTLDHMTLPGKVIVNTVPGEKIPEQFYNSKAICNHCDRIRTRKETFVVENEKDQSMLQVGRSCLKDFLGHNPLKVLSFLRALYDLMEELEEGFGGGGGGESYLNLEELLTNTAGVIRVKGWVPRSASSDERTSSAAHVCTLMYPAFNKYSKKLQDELKEEIGDNSKDIVEAEKALVWLKDQEPDNEYMHNIKNIADVNHIPGKLIGYACSIIAAYHRAEERLRIIKEENADKLNEHVKGDIKDRVDMEVTVKRIIIIDGMFGVVRLHLMMDNEGRSVNWFANTCAGMEVDGKYLIKGTIKKFDQYKDWKQTHVNRVKVLEVLEEVEEEK